MMEIKKDNPGIYLPPPTIYIGIFLTAYFMQKLIPFNKAFYYTAGSKITGVVILLIGLGCTFPALVQFFKTKNSLVTINPATSLQTTGIFSLSRNPMYVSLLLLYTGLSFIIGNWWNFLLLPVLFFVVQEYVIKREEKYLDRRFGQTYFDYKTKVRRWI